MRDWVSGDDLSGLPVASFRVSELCATKSQMKPRRAAALALVGWYLVLKRGTIRCGVTVSLDAGAKKWLGLAPAP